MQKYSLYQITKKIGILFISFFIITKLYSQNTICYSDKAYDYLSLHHYNINFKTLTCNDKFNLFSKDSFLFVQGQYENNSKIGKWVFYFKTGKINCILNFNNNIRVGKAISFYESGNKKSEWYYNSKGFKDSIEIEWYENGIIKKLSTYKNDKLNGKYCEWDSIGNLFYESFYCPDTFFSENCNCKIIEALNGESYDFLYPTIYYPVKQILAYKLIKDENDNEYYYIHYSIEKKIIKKISLKKKRLMIGGTHFYFYSQE